MITRRKIAMKSLLHSSRLHPLAGAVLFAAVVLQAPAAAGEEEAFLAAYKMAQALARQGKLPEAGAAYEKVLVQSERLFGPKHDNTATILLDLGGVSKQQGRYAKAEKLYLRCLTIRETNHGKKHLGVAVVFNNLGDLYQYQGRYEEAESHYRRSLVILERDQGKDHPNVATVLTNLGTLYITQRKFDLAEPFLERGLKIREAKREKDSPEVGQSVVLLAGLACLQGQYPRAERLYQRGLHILETRLGPDHWQVGVALSGLGSCYHAWYRYARADACFRRSIKILETGLGKNHPHVAAALNALALLCDERGRYAEAEPLFRRSLAIMKANLPEDHPHMVEGMNNLALLYLHTSQLDEAERLLRRCLRLTEGRFGKEDPELAKMLTNLVGLHGAKKHWVDAARASDAAYRILRRHAARILPALPEEDQLAFLQTQHEPPLQVYLSLGLTRRTDAATAALSAGWLVNGKAIAQQTLAERILLARDRADPALAKTAEELAVVRARLAGLTFADSTPGQGASRLEKLARLGRQEQELAKKLGRAVGRPAREDPWVDLAEVRRALPTDTVLIDLVHLYVFDFRVRSNQEPWGPAHYAAWVVPAQGEEPVRVIDLGPADKIEAAVSAVRKALSGAPADLGKTNERQAERQVARPLNALSDLVLRPLWKHVGKKPRWVLSPDASLWLVPWAALLLPDGSYAVEKHQLSYVVNGRDVLAPVGQVKPRWDMPPLVLADPDFDLKPDKAARNEKPGQRSGDQLPVFSRLPGTAAEARAVVPLLKRYAARDPLVHTGKDARESTFKKARKPRLVVLSTHGFFLEDQTSARPPRLAAPGRRGLTLVAAGLPRAREPKARVPENPLLRCGLALAGANQRDKAPEGADDGILTGLEIVGTDLRGTELVVLSACDTGLGQVRNGEGVAGLRQAFQLAGAKAVVAALWQIPDKETTALMTAFFEHLAAKKGKAEALRLAQLQIIKERRAKGQAAHPFYWAAFTLTGQWQ
jgi:CHAT domain-containing protein/Tfp pilus assembly protein PilF